MSSFSFSCDVTTSQCLPRPFDAELLDDGLEVEHLLHVAGDELADLVDDEHEGVAGLAPSDQLGRAIRELAGVDVGLALGGVGTRSRCPRRSPG